MIESGRDRRASDARVIGQKFDARATDRRFDVRVIGQRFDATKVGEKANGAREIVRACGRAKGNDGQFRGTVTAAKNKAVIARAMKKNVANPKATKNPTGTTARRT
jgi:hypothetical protein